MFFIIGLVMAAIGSAFALFLVGAPLLIARAWGLLWGDRRLWWTAGAIPAVFVALFWVEASNHFKVPTDQLHKGFVSFQRAGVYGSVFILWLAGFVGLCFWGRKWRQPRKWLAPVGAALSLILLAMIGIDLHQQPTAIRQERAENLSRWITAVKYADLSTLREMAAAGNGHWSYAKELNNSPVSWAFGQEDRSLLACLIEIHPRPDELRTSLANLTASSSDSEAAFEFIVNEVDDRQAMLRETFAAAVSYGNQPFFSTLLEKHDAWPNTVTTQSVLMTAVNKGHEALAKELVSRGARVNHLDGRTQYSAETALQGAVLFQPQLVPWLLESGADPNLCHDGSPSPLMRAVEKRRPETVTQLIDAGANIHATDEQGNAAIHFASRGHKPDESMIQLLLQHGADPTRPNQFGFVPAARITEPAP